MTEEYKAEIHQIRPGNPWWEYCKEVCKASKKLYNNAQFLNREVFSYGNGILSYSQSCYHFKGDDDYKKLPAKVSQTVLKQVYLSWDSFFKSLKAWKLSPEKFTGKPGIPSFLGNELNMIKFTNQAVSKKLFGKGFINPSQSPIMIPVKPGMVFQSLAEVRIVPKTGCFNIEVIYKNEVKGVHHKSQGVSAAIDIGLDNLATVVFSDPTIQPLAADGKPLKSKNQWFNKETARLKKLLISGVKGSRKIDNIRRNTNNFIHTYLHQISSRLVNEFEKLGVKEVAIGKNPQWKTKIAIGKVGNQNFCQIPHAKFISLLTQKLERVGITVKVGEESYTSKASFLDWDMIPSWKPGSAENFRFSGKRVETKKYKASSGTVINADVNGAFNIGRKVIPNSFGHLKSIVERNSGCVVAHPRRISLFSQND